MVIRRFGMAELWSQMEYGLDEGQPIRKDAGLFEEDTGGCWIVVLLLKRYTYVVYWPNVTVSFQQ